MRKCAKAAVMPITGLALLALAASSPAHAAGESEGPVPITDPVVLQSLGVAPGTAGVYATPRALRDMASTPAEQQAAQAAFDAARSSLFGTASWGYSPVLMHEFFPLWTDTVTPSLYFTAGNRGRYCASGTRYYVAPIHGMPHGARLEFVTVWLYDASDEDITVDLRKYCSSDDPGQIGIIVLAQAQTIGQTGYQRVTLGAGVPPDIGLDEDIDLEHCNYQIALTLDDQVGFCSEGSDLTIQRARAEWKRQVSPAPAVATFDDVPTDSSFFRYVEALAASGITSGCDTNSFCPSAPLTRGQMAVFLAKALGLHWGSFGTF